MYSERTGEPLYELGDAPLWIRGGRVFPVRDEAGLYAVAKHCWIERQMAKMPPLTPAQRALGTRVKRDLLRGPGA